jgi:serine/threonine protein kinase
MDSFNIKLGAYFKERLDICSLNLIGQGGFKFVFEVIDSELGKMVALYTIKKPTPGYDEVEILKVVFHPNIIKFIEEQKKEVTGTQLFTTELMTGTLLGNFKRGSIHSDKLAVD